MRRLLLLLALALPIAAMAGGGENATALMKNAEGDDVGKVLLRQTPNGLVAQIDVRNLPAGTHGFHVHEVGRCEPPFDSAGGHYAPRGNQHGMESPKGRHAGDLPNLHVPNEGKLEVTLFIDQLSLRGKNPLFDKDGSAFVIHAGADDYQTDPAGAAGDRIACGVVKSTRDPASR